MHHQQIRSLKMQKTILKKFGKKNEDWYCLFEREYKKYGLKKMSELWEISQSALTRWRMSMNIKPIGNNNKIRHFDKKQLDDYIHLFYSKFGRVPTTTELRENDGKEFPTESQYVKKVGAYTQYINSLGFKTVKQLKNEESQKKRIYKFGNKHVKKKKISFCKLRFKILARDNFTCQYCGKTVKDGAILQIDHIIPLSRGGTWGPSNLITSCRECNLGKSNLLIDNLQG